MKQSAPGRFRDLLLQVLHADATQPAAGRLAALTPEDWAAFTEEAIHYRLAFQVRECLRAGPRRALVPEACFERLTTAVRETLQRNLRQQAYLREVLTACRRADVPVIAIKGLWLVEAVYRDLKARASGDIDLLFQHGDMARFTRVACELGFDLPPKIDSIVELRPSSHEYPLHHPAARTRFDVHWALTGPEEAAVDEASLWRRSEDVTLVGAPCRTLRLEDHLLYLCFHAVGHHRLVYVGPRALLDVATVVARPPRAIDWDDFTARAHDLGWARDAWLMLDLVRHHLGVASPAAVLDALQPANAGDPAIAPAATDALFLDQRATQALSANIVRLVDEPSWGGRIRLVFARLFVPPGEIALEFKVRKGSALLPWLYLKRWALLPGRHLSKFWRILAGDRARSDELARTRVVRRWMREEGTPAAGRRPPERR